jgi:hypothetical protein
VDPYFNYTTLLLAGNQPSGVTDTNNNVFKDSSANNFTITRNPASGPNAPTQGTFTPFSKVNGRWGNYFDGSGDTLSAASNAAFALGTGDFTVETFAYYAAQSNIDAIAVANWDGGTWGSNKWSLHLDHTTARSKVTFWFHNYSSSVPLLTSSSTLAIGQWYHVAVSRSGNTFRLFINGILDVSATNSTSLDGGTNSPIYVGGGVGGAGSQYFNGYLSSTRLVKGTAVYTASFTTPTSPLTNISGTSLLTCQSNRFIDNSTNAFALTVSGNPSVQTFSPFPTTASYSAGTNGGSGYFDGTGDYLTSPNTSQFAPAGDFTIGVWVYPTSLAASFSAPLGNYTGNNSTDWLIEFTSGGTLNFYTNGSTIRINSSAGAIKANQWHYIALCRSGSTITGYLNGTSIGTYSQSGTFGSATKAIGIGGRTDTQSPMTGYITSVILIDGSVNTSVPTAPSTNVSGTSLLCNFTNGGIIDNTMSNDLETVGGAAISTTQSKFGGSSISFPSNDSYLLTNPTTSLEFGSGDFTIEFWWYPTSTARQALYHGSFGADFSIGMDYSSVSTNQKIGLWASSNGSSWNLINSDAGGNGIGTTTINQNAWNHIAYVRYGTTWMLFVNGVRDLNLTGISGSIASRPTYPKGIGVWWNTTSFAEASGYIDDFRITKGIARYVQNFTPPTSAFLTL